jgi:hypothetical protein
MTGTGRIRAVLAVVALVAASLLVAGPARAGGPTSVLLVNPVTSQARALYATDTAYEELADLVGAFSATPGTAGRSGRAHEHGAPVTVTWLIHDVYVWRVDRIYVDAKGGPWISTQTALGDPARIWDSPVDWHTSTDGPALTTLLAGLTMTRTGAAEAAPAAPSQPSAGPAAASPSGAATAAGKGASSMHSLLWGLAGLALGAGLSVGLIRALPVLRRRRDVRLEPEGVEPAWTTDVDGAPVPLDTLASPRR